MLPVGMLRVGLTGGLATGKTFVAAEFERLGCDLIYADRLGHEVMRPGGPAYPQIVEKFGSDILLPDGTIDRRGLGRIVFADASRLAELNSIIHPAVFELEDSLTREAVARNPHAIVIVEAAILVETGRFRAFDRLIVTTCPEEIQIARAMRRDHLSREEVLKRIQRQMPMKEKLTYADFVIDTGTSKEHTVDQVRAVYKNLKDFAAINESRPHEF